MKNKTQEIKDIEIVIHGICDDSGMLVLSEYIKCDEQFRKDIYDNYNVGDIVSILSPCCYKTGIHKNMILTI